MRRMPALFLLPGPGLARWPSLFLVAGLCTACAAPLQAAGCGDAAPVREIVWEQDCSGCPQGLRLRWGADGQAQLTVTGKARFRTAERTQSAPLPPAEFERLVAELAAAGLFALGPRHEPPDVADGRWTQWQVRCDGAVHEVFRREDAGPPALDRLDAVAQAWRRRLWPTP